MAMSPDVMNVLLSMGRGRGGPGYPSAPPMNYNMSGIYGGPTRSPMQPPPVLPNYPPSMMNPQAGLGGMGFDLPPNYRPIDMQTPGSPYMGMAGSTSTGPGQTTGGFPGPSGPIYSNPFETQYGVGGGAGGGDPMGSDGGMPVGEIPPGLASFFDSKGYRPMDPYAQEGPAQTRPMNPGPNPFFPPNSTSPGPMGGIHPTRPRFMPGGRDGGPMRQPPTGGGINYGPPAIKKKPGAQVPGAGNPRTGMGQRGR